MTPSSNARAQAKAVVERVDLVVSALATRVALHAKDGDRGSVGAIDLKISSARVTDMTAYNGYFPEGAPLRLLGGEADLIAEIHLEPDAADGMVRLQPQGLKAQLDDQQISGELVLSVEDIRGDVRMEIECNRVLIPKAFAGSDKVDVGAKGLIDDKHREGIFFVRYGALKGILKVKNGGRNFDILGARKKFEAYVPGKTALKVGRGDPDEVESATDDTADAGKDTATVIGDDRPETVAASTRDKKVPKDEKPFSILDDLSNR